MSKMNIFCKSKSKFLVLGRFQFILLLHNSFEVRLFFNFNFDTTMSCLLNSHLNLICGTRTMLLFQNFIISLFFSYIHPYLLMWLSINSIATWIITKKWELLMLNMALHIKFIYNLKHLWLWYSKLSTYLCFQPR
jgi:hypothetical protein